MATRIRLQRHGRKGKAFFHIVAADSRAKRDGKFIEKLGVYNPNTNPATIELNFDSALKWVQVGAEMTDTARAIMSYKGVLHKHHLLRGVDKGAFSLEEAEKRFADWQASKDAKITGKKDNLAKSAAQDKAARMKAEEEANAAKAAAIEAKNAPEVTEEVVEENVSGEVEGTATEDVHAASDEPEAEATTDEPAAEADAPAEGDAE
jgi:small subunit ribosomal protein S16